MIEAPFHAEIAHGPENAEAFWLTTEDGMRIRMGVWDGRSDGATKGTVLIFPGRTEYIEKYGMSAQRLAERGYSSIAIDWRGQGLGQRILDDRLVGHVEKFTDYQRDVRAVLTAVDALDLPRPLFLFGHSMGGCIGLRALIDGLNVEAAMFTGPMWDIALPKWRRAVGRAFTSVTQHIGLDNNLAPGSLRTSYVISNPFPDNMLTSDPDMYALLRKQLEAYPDLGLGGPSNNWVREALSECRDLKRHPTPDIEAITFLGTNERIVDVDTIHERMARWPNGTLHIIENGEHEIAMESLEVQAKIFDAATALFDKYL